MTRLHPDIVGRVEAYICVAALINFLVGAKKIGLVEVQAALRAEGLKVSMPTIGKEAYRLGLGTSSGRRPGKLAPNVPRGGRPPGPGKQRSPHREPAIKMRDEGKTVATIAAELGIKRQAVERLLKTAPKKSTTAPTDEAT